MTSKTDIWMPLYIGDFLADTSHLDAERTGAYLLFLMHYWRKGPLAENIENLICVGKLRGQNAANVVRALLDDFFTKEEDGLWHQKRQDIEREKAQLQKRRGVAGANAKWGIDTDSDAKQLRSQRISEARKKGTHTEEEWSALQAFCRHQCVRCGALNCELVKDHILPIYRGGSDGIDNIQPLCRKCNASKGPESTDHRPEGWKNVCKTPADSVLDGWTSPSPSPSPLSLTPPPSPEEKPKKQKHSSKTKVVKPVDPRRIDFIDDLKLHWNGFAKTKFVFDGNDGTQVDLFLKSWPDFTRTQWRDCLRNRKFTPGVIPTERIYRWISKLGNYLNGPLNEYGKLIIGNGENYASIPNGTGNQIVGVLQNSLGRTECQDASWEDGNLPSSIEAGRGDAGIVYAGSDQLRLESVSSSDEKPFEF